MGLIYTVKSLFEARYTSHEALGEQNMVSAESLLVLSPLPDL